MGSAWIPDVGAGVSWVMTAAYVIDTVIPYAIYNKANCLNKYSIF